MPLALAVREDGPLPATALELVPLGLAVRSSLLELGARVAGGDELLGQAVGGALGYRHPARENTVDPLARIGGRMVSGALAVTEIAGRKAGPEGGARCARGLGINGAVVLLAAADAWLRVMEAEARCWEADESQAGAAADRMADAGLRFADALGEVGRLWREGA